MSETINPAAGQFWTLETDGTRVEVLYVTQYSLDQMVCVKAYDRIHPDTEVRTAWFANHATPLHTSLDDAHAEALLENLARRAASLIADLTDRVARSMALLETERAAHQATRQDLNRVRVLLHEAELKA